MAFKDFYNFVSYLSTFSFTRNYLVGRITFFFILLLTRPILRCKTKHAKNVLKNKKSTRELLKDFTNHVKELLDYLLSNERPPLHIAIVLQDLDLVKQILDVKPEDVNFIMEENGYTPLHIAAYIGSEDICNHLLQNGANINAKGKNGRTPLHLAVRYNRIGASKLLLQNGADIDARKSNGCNVLHLAIEYHGDEDIIKLVIAYGVDIEAKCNYLQTPLFDALHYIKKTNIFEVLIANGANVNVKTYIGESLLHYAIERDKYDFVKILIETDTLKMVKNMDGKTPMEVVFSKNDMKTMKLMMLQSKDRS